MRALSSHPMPAARRGRTDASIRMHKKSPRRRGLYWRREAAARRSSQRCCVACATFVTGVVAAFATGAVFATGCAGVVFDTDATTAGDATAASFMLIGASPQASALPHTPHSAIARTEVVRVIRVSFGTRSIMLRRTATTVKGALTRRKP